MAVLEASLLGRVSGRTRRGDWVQPAAGAGPASEDALARTEARSGGGVGGCRHPVSVLQQTRLSKRQGGFFSFGLKSAADGDKLLCLGAFAGGHQPPGADLLAQ